MLWRKVAVKELEFMYDFDAVFLEVVELRGYGKAYICCWRSSLKIGWPAKLKTNNVSFLVRKLCFPNRFQYTLQSYKNYRYRHAMHDLSVY